MQKKSKSPTARPSAAESPRPGSPHFVDALEAIRAGELVVYPTETFYGLGADASSAAALDRLFQAKQREPDKPLPLIVADFTMARALAREIPVPAYRLAEAFWPGPLTLVFPARDGLHPGLVGPDGVGVRVSAHPVARKLVAELGRPITATSANLAGGSPARTVAEAKTSFGNKVKVYLEGGNLTASAPSTVVGFAEGKIKVIREGAISSSQLSAVLSAQVLE